MNNMTTLQAPKLNTGQTDIGMTVVNLVDVVFLLLMFFMVTTVFPENKGLVIDKPASQNTAKVASENIVIKIDSQGSLYFRNQQVVLADIKRLLLDEIQLHPHAAVIIHADKKSTTETLIQVIDAAKSGGLTKIGVATDDIRNH